MNTNQIIRNRTTGEAEVTNDDSECIGKDCCRNSLEKRYIGVAQIADITWLSDSHEGH